MRFQKHGLKLGPIAIAIVLANPFAALSVTIQTVSVGHAGNAADMRYVEPFHPSGVGAVSYDYNIGRTEVTNAQYTAFLNAVAASDPYGLYNSYMDIDTRGGIVRGGTVGSYTYALKAPAQGGAYSYANKPAIYVNAGNAMRFANWLHNGQPIGGEDGNTTEDGAYSLHGATDADALAAVTRNPGARWFIPTENEWYKAAYFDPTTDTYFDFPTGTNAATTSNPPSSDTGNSANFDRIGDDDFPFTDVGAYTLSASPWGTFDQGGNTWEWTEAVYADSWRGLRGGSYASHQILLRASAWIRDPSTTALESTGFRAASAAIPEPSTIALACAALAVLPLQRRMTRRQSKGSERLLNRSDPLFSRSSLRIAQE
jgi:formylglycine-generating enzyme required for sulfatase activity